MEGDVNARCFQLVKVNYFYPRPPGGGRLHELEDLFFGLWISIHALRVEGDSSALSIRAEDLRISIHALRVEGDLAPAC